MEGRKREEKEGRRKEVQNRFNFYFLGGKFNDLINIAKKIREDMKKKCIYSKRKKMSSEPHAIHTRGQEKVVEVYKETITTIMNK